MIKLNETPVRTSRNFNINNIKIENLNMPKKVNEFKNYNITRDSSRDLVDTNIGNMDVKYGVGLEDYIRNNSNNKIRLNVTTKTSKDIIIDYKFDKENLYLIENIEIVLEENTKSTIIIRYDSEKELEAFHSGIIKVIAKNGSNSNIIIVNLLNKQSNNFLSIDNKIEENATLKYTVVDFGGKNSITNYYSDLVGDNSNNIINGIYLGTDNQLIDLNYIGELRGKKSNINIEIQGALKDNSKKHFKGTIDFKRGAKKAKGNENENCMLLSNTARSLALPMLLCQEEDVEGNHSTSSGKAGEKELFYIMSRGFSEKDALKLLVRAKFNSIIEGIKNYFDGDVQKAVQEYFYLERQMLKSCDFTIIAHCDLIKKQNGPKVKSPLFDQNSDWYKKEIALLADKIASAGVVAEVNVGGMARGYMATPFPHGELLSLLIQKNVPLTLSSDSHSAETLDFAFDETVQMLKKAGCKELAFIEGKNSFKMQPL